MNCFTRLRMVYKILLPVSVTLVLVLSLLAWQIQSKGSDIVQSIAERELAALGGLYSAEVSGFIELGLAKTTGIAETISTLQESKQPLRRAQIISMLGDAYSDNILNVGAAFLPESIDLLYTNTPGSDEAGQFYPEVAFDGLRLMGKQYFTAPFFTVPAKTQRAHIPDPYFFSDDRIKDVLVLTMSSPVIVDSVFKGVVFLDFAIQTLVDRVDAVQVYATGSASVMTQAGLVMMHRNPKLILKNLFETDSWRDDADIQPAFKAGKSYLTRSMQEGEENFFYFHPFEISETGQILYFVMIVPVDEVLAEVAQLTNVTLVASIFALCTLLIVIFIGVRASIKPLAKIVAATEEVTRGNFGVKLDSKDFGGEILDLKLALDAMLGSLVENISKAETMSKDAQEQTLKAQDAMAEAEAARIAAEGAKQEGMLTAASQLESVVNILSTASQKLSLQIGRSEQVSIEQASRMGETATAMEEMNSTVFEVSQSAGSASDISAQTRDRAESGARVVQDAVVGIQHVQTVSLALKEDMGTLAVQASSISEIMTVISDIADQTNLLALNAAIEAARAGDAGRGFAVVADEVRKLAEKTMNSTTDVGNAIKSIQASVATSILQVDQAVELIGAATEQSNQSGGALNEIVILVDSTADQVRAIATASEQQSATSEEINRAISEITELSDQGVQTMREAALAINDLALQAQTLSSLIEEMKRV